MNEEMRELREMVQAQHDKIQELTERLRIKEEILDEVWDDVDRLERELVAKNGEIRGCQYALQLLSGGSK